MSMLQNFQIILTDIKKIRQLRNQIHIQYNFSWQTYCMPQITIQIHLKLINFNYRENYKVNRTNMRRKLQRYKS